MREAPILWVVAGAQWGDEGKGKTVDILAEQADGIYKVNGGRNAGHSVRNHRGSFSLHLVPSGIFYEDKYNIIGNGVVFSLQYGLEEIQNLESKGVSTRNLFISSRTHLTLRYHEMEDKIQEDLRKEGKVGTTGTGNGPAYSDKANRLGIRAEMLKDPNAMMDELRRTLSIKSELYFPNQTIPDEFQPDYYEVLIREAANTLGPQIIDIYDFNEEMLRRGSTLLIEGSQGALLDIDGGTYPMVTSSSCSISGLIASAGLPNMKADRAIAIFKAYQTRVGEGPMPTELFNETADLIRIKGHEFGTTTGRPRRIGWFDGIAARKSQQMNGFTESAITLSDVLTDIEDLQIAVGYSLNGKSCSFPSNSRVLALCQPIYDDRSYSWREEFQGATNWTDIPERAQSYLKKIAQLTGIQPTYIGTGPRREDGIKLNFDIR